MHVLQLINTMNVGGAESSLYNLVLHLASSDQKRLQISVATLYQVGHLGQCLVDAGVSVHCLNMSARYSPNGIVRLLSLLHRNCYDLVHVHLFPASLIGSLASLFTAKLPWIFTEHSVWNRRRRIRFLRFADWFIYSRFVRVAAVSSQVARSLIDWQPHIKTKVQIIPNGVVIPIAPVDGPGQAGPKGSFTVLFAGRLQQMKGLDILLHAVSILREPTLRLLIAGDGELCAELHGLAERLGIQDRVEFLGKRQDIQQLMVNADALVLPSRWEGLPMVILEAMAVGCPVIASEVGGIPELIQDGTTGWLVPPDDPESLAEALAFVLSDPNRASEVGQRARQRVAEGYSIEEISQRVLNLYSETLASDCDPLVGETV